MYWFAWTAWVTANKIRLDRCSSTPILLINPSVDHNETTKSIQKIIKVKNVIPLLNFAFLVVAKIFVLCQHDEWSHLRGGLSTKVGAKFQKYAFNRFIRVPNSLEILVKNGFLIITIITLWIKKSILLKKTYHLVS